MMEDLKTWYQSKTVWGALIAVLASLLQAAGIHLDAGGQGQLVDSLVSLSGAVGGLVAVYGRLSAKKAVDLGNKRS
jgi:hypothetical protein